MTKRRLGVSLLLILTCSSLLLSQQAKRLFTFEEMMKVKRVAEPQLSPDGKWVAYTISTYSVEKNSHETNIWLVPSSGGAPLQLTQGASDTHPRWSPDSSRLAFVSTRSGSSQIWNIPVHGGEAQLVPTAGLEASGVVWSPDGKVLAFVSDVYPGCTTPQCNEQQEAESNANPVKARMLDHLLYRHWKSWKDGKRSHLFVVPVEGGKVRDLTPGDYDVPPFSLGGPEGYAFSPDGREMCFVRNTDPDEAYSTNSDLFLVSTYGQGEAKRITTNPAADDGPAYSPDGRFIAYRAQSRPGYESDRWQLMVYDRTSRQSRSLTANLDRSIDELAWSADSQALYFAAADLALEPIYRVRLDGGAPEKMIDSHTNGELQVARDGKLLIFSQQSLSAPTEIFSATADGKQLKALTTDNQQQLARVQFGQPESVWYTGADGAKVQAWILKPPVFDPAKKYPMLLAIHGGPQGIWEDGLSYRWNLQVFAARGYVVMAVNPRGSTSFGQDFTDGIRDDWGGKVYEDVMKGVDYAISLGYVDKDRMAAAGGSYGGYLVNWLAGHTDRFKCLISHDGVFNLTSMYGATEELWFPEWEFKGTPWSNPESYARWSPQSFAKNFKTPMLVIHGELDYRVPIGEGFQLFTTLQRQKVPSKMLYFPDEGHWVMKPKNSELWYKTFLGWLDEYLK
jgi:dipeptidyl aminopeptidase/acylaminoacyl peptidase